MSADSFAVLRKNAGEDISKLAEEHFKHDLQDSDRDSLKAAAGKVGTHAAVGSLLGLGLGLFLALRVRRPRTQMFHAFRLMERPSQLKLVDGREELRDLADLMKPSTLGDVAAYFFFGVGGLFLGGETGLLTGGASANRIISRDPESMARIEGAFRKFRAEVLRKEADELDGGKGVVGVLGF